MKNIVKLEKSIEDIKKQADTIRRKLKERIESLPDNPRINRLGKNCFTIKLSDLGDKLNLSPAHHDFKRQYQLICEVIDRKDLRKLPEFFKGLIDKGILVDHPQYRRLNLHKDVIEFLREILY